MVKKRNRIGIKKASPMLLIGAVAVIIVAASFIFSGAKKDDLGVSNVNQLKVNQADSISRVGESSKAYNDKVDEDSSKKALKASEEKRSFISPIVSIKDIPQSPGLEKAEPVDLFSPLKPAVVKPEDEVIEVLTPLVRVPIEEVRAIEAAERRLEEDERISVENISALNEAMIEKMENIIAVREYEGAEGELTSAGRRGNALSGNETGLGGSLTAGSLPGALVGTVGVNTVAPVDPEPAVVPPVSPFKIGEVVYAVNNLTLNSDEFNGIVRATLLSGKASGAVVMGAFTRINASLKVEFNTLIMPDGKTFKFKGYAVSAFRQQATIDVDVNHHYFQRWGSLIAASFIEGFGASVAQSGKSKEATQSGGTITTEPAYNKKRQTLIALGKVGAVVGRKASVMFDRPPTVVFPANSTFGVLIMEFGGE